ncbi:hypothetical protein [Lactiplantibacillus xiangfangensis]|uniref:Uncharacterized protein n=1 Tax=Lactiplantibacillus xiangfangensis TaxID=942150 RepID=A0A0R2MN19_9LACO|nr:hypothetical protein [Lactiplantibacillus xiangfangensis]KRO13900.1 hypothetical protein IV64_GL001916 [Lactiplantibacillus xiangfangensis]
MKKMTYQLDKKSNQAERFDHQEQARKAKKALIDRYRKHHVSTTAHATSKPVVATKENPDAELKRENRRLQRQLKKLKQAKQDQGQAHALRQQLHQMKHQLQVTQENLQQIQAQVVQLQQSCDQVSAAKQNLQHRLTQTETYISGASDWLAYSLIIAAQTEEKMTEVRQQAILNQEQRPITAKEKEKLKQYHDFKHQVMGLDAALKRAHERTDMLVEQNTQLRRQPKGQSKLTTLPLVDQVMRELTVERIGSVKWLPDAYHRYRKILLEDVMVNDGNRIFGYFVKHQGGYYFQVVNGQAYQQYRCVGQSKKRLSVNAVYAGKIDGNRVVITTVFRDVTPSQLRLHHELQLHRRHARKDYRDLLPADAEAKLSGKKVLVVTWQRTQRLNQMFRSFGIDPIIVNDQERSISWITTAALSKQIDFTLLLSEGLSHSLLATIGKPQIKARHDLELVYNESPEELLRRCYRFFSR